MKKITMIVCFLMMIAILPVQAQENRLYFTEEGDRLYYESKLIDENVFLKHTDMTPGSSYTDELTIENGTNTKYTLYFKVLPKEQSEEAEELLENITMRITLDGKEIYNGIATGQDYLNNHTNLQEVILLGDFTPSQKSKMVVETSLNKEYSNTEYHDYSSIDWSFYAQYEDSTPVEIVEVPNTMKDSFPWISIVAIVFVGLGIGTIYYAKKKEN